MDLNFLEKAINKLLSRINILSWVLLLILLILIPFTVGAQESFTGAGTVDLRNFDFEHDRALPLDGEWLFISGIGSSAEAQPVMVPGSWKKSGLPNQGSGTYSLNILLPEDRPALSMKFGNIYSSAQIRINGTVYLSEGHPGSSESETISHWAPVLLNVNNEEGAVLLLEIDVANFNHAHGGIISSVLLGDSAFLNKQWGVNRLLELLITGIILWMGVYHLLIYILRPKDSGASLSFALACLFFAVRLVFVGEYVLSSFAGEGLWSLFLRIEYICYLISTYFLIRFFSQLYEKEYFSPAVTIYQFITIFYGLIVLLTPSVFFTSLLPAHQITLLISFLLAVFCISKAMIHKQTGAGLILAGITILLATVLNDVLFYKVQFFFYNSSVLGSLIFMVVDSIVLGRIFTRKFAEAEELSVKLCNANAELAISRREIEKKNSELRLLASSDYLTGLPNRMALFELVDKELSRAGRNGMRVGVLLVDLDHFKRINDSYGHSHGDQLLCEFSRRMKKSLRKADTIFRLGGDEFTIIVPDLTEPENLIRVAKKVMSVLDEPIILDSLKSKMSTSLGISQYPEDGDSVNTLLKNADIALYEAKKQGRNRFVCFNKDMQKLAEDRFYLISRMPDALSDGAFELYFQPQMNMKNYSIYGLEALIRWKDSERGFISPSVFIPIMEETGFITTLGEWILEQSLKITFPWVQDNPDLFISVNISSVQFYSPHFLDILDFTLIKTGFPSQNLVLELTEGVIMHDSENTLKKLMEIRGRGIKISVDDFGTGYSSLSYLKKFPLDHLKIDQSFISDLFNTHFDKDIVGTIIDLAAILGLEVIAEGIETVPQQEFLESRGCYILQGYLTGRPVPVDELEHMIADRDSVKEYLQML